MSCMVVLQVFTLVAVLRDGYVEISADGGAVWWSGIIEPLLKEVLQAGYTVITAYGCVVWWFYRNSR